MTFEEWKAKHDDEIVNAATVFFNYERGVDTKTCYDELEWILRKAFISGQNHCNHVPNEELEKENAELKGLRCCENCKNINLQLYWRESEEIDKRRQFVCGTCGNRKNWKYLGKTVGITETQQLNKAREIIKMLADDLSMYSGNYQKELLDAEQFIKEIEK